MGMNAAMAAERFRTTVSTVSAPQSTGNMARPIADDADGADQSERLSWVESFVMARPSDTLSLLRDVANGVPGQINYQSREFEGTLETLRLGARIIAGYLHVASSDIIGWTDAGFTHAWVEVFVPGAGWIAFDLTNRAMGPVNLIPVAAARHITQVAPVTGSFHGRSGDLLGMRVEVAVAPA